MDSASCPIHAAALESRRARAAEPLLRKVGRASRTEECSRCEFCMKAIECLTNPTADSWTELWHNAFVL